MFKLAQKRKEQAEAPSRPAGVVSQRNRLLLKEIPEASQAAADWCQLLVDNPDLLHKFRLVICPREGYWKGGRFEFDIDVPEDYNFSPPKCVCKTKIWHPNITENGEVCLSILREKLDEHSWLPTRNLTEVVWGLSSLFTDLLNFNDPLNVEAAEMHARSDSEFAAKVSDYVKKYASSHHESFQERAETVKSSRFSFSRWLGDLKDT